MKTVDAYVVLYDGKLDLQKVYTEECVAAKDARIAELEAEVRRLDAGWHEANKQALEQKLAATPSEDGGEMPTPIALVRERDWNLEKTLFAVFYSNSDPKPGDQLMTVAQHSRIVAAKDAEIARLRELHENAHSAAKTLMAERATLMEQAAHCLEVNAPSGGCIETNIADELRAEAEQLRAQPARQVGGDESAPCPICDGHGSIDFDDVERRARNDEKWGRCLTCRPYESARAALAPAAVVMPKPLRWLDQKDGGVHRFDIVGEKLVPLIDADEVARLNRRAIPVELLERTERHLTNWLELNACECEGFHVCGRNEVKSDRDELRALLGKDEGGQ